MSFTSHEQQKPRLHPSELLRAQRERIIKEWEHRTQSEIPAAAGKSHHILTDDLPKFLDEMAASLERSAPKLAEAQLIAEGHANQRSGVPGYDLEQVLAEYRILLQVVFDFISDSSPMSKHDRDIIIEIIHRGKAAAARRYTEQALEKHERIAGALRDSEEFRRKMLESSEDCFKVLDLNGRLIDITEKSLGHLEISDIQSVLNKPWADFWKDPKDREAAQEAVLTAVRGQIGHFIGHYKTPSGQREWWDVTVTPINGPAENPERLLAVSRDVTEQRKAQIQLERNETRFREMFDYSGVGKVLTDPKTKKILRANARFCELLGYSEEELRSKSFVDITYPEDRGSQIEAYESNVKTPNTHWNIEKRYLKKDGSFLWTAVYVTSFLDPDGQMTALATVIDITEQKKLEFERQILLKRETELRLEAEHASAAIEAFIRSSPIATAQIDLKYRYIGINDTLARLNGKPVREHIGKTIWEIIPEHAEFAKQILDQVVASKKPFHLAEQELVSPADHESHWMYSTFFPIFSDGHVTSIGYMSVDITDRKRLEESRARLLKRISALQSVTDAALSKTTTMPALLEKSLEAIYENTDCDTVAILILNEKSGLLELVQAKGLGQNVVGQVAIPRTEGIVGRIFTREKAEIVNDTSKEDPKILHGDLKNVQSMIGVPLRTKKRTIGVLQVGRFNLSPFTEDDLSLLQVVGDRLATAVDNANLYESLQTSVRDLMVERNLREQFVNTLTHDLRNPLAAAKASVHLIMRQLDRPEKLPQLAARISSSIDRADQMILDLLDVNRVRAGRALPIALSKCDVVALVRHSVDEFSSIYGPRFKFSAPPHLEAIVSCKDISRIVENLLSNAVKYGSDHEISIQVEKSLPDFFEIQVHNWGQPIPEAEQKHLFEPFMRSSRVEAEGQKKGWGLGLALVKGVVDAHHGRISVKSSAQEGTTFTIQLPIHTIIERSS